MILYMYILKHRMRWGHQGSIPDKIKAIENIDQKIIGPIVGELEDLCMDFRMLVLPDHPDADLCPHTYR